MRNTIGLWVLGAVLLAGCPTRVVYDADGGTGGGPPSGGGIGGSAETGGSGGKSGASGAGGQGAAGAGGVTGIGGAGGTSATGGLGGSSSSGGAAGTGGLGGSNTGGAPASGGGGGGHGGSGGSGTGGVVGTGGRMATGGMTGTGGSAGVCTPNKKRCSNLQPQTCDASGSTWQNTGSACPYVCVDATGTCTGTCTPGAPGCSGMQPQMCDANGAWQNVGAACGTCHTCSTTTGSCVPIANGLTCDDGQACTSPDSCQNGVCTGSQILCNSPPACKLNTTCSAGACNYTQNVPDGTMDTKCGSGTPYCYSGGCVRCTADTQCSGSTPSCDPATHTCVCRRPSAGNRLTNPGFDGSFNGWTVYSAALIADSEACPESNAVFDVNAEEDPHQCIALTPGFYYLGGRFSGGQGGDKVRLYFYSGPDCTDSSTSTIDPAKKLFDFNLATPLGGWTSASQGFTAPANTVSARLGVFGLQLYVDQLYVNTTNQY